MRKGEKGEWKGDQIRYREEQIFSEKAQSMQACSIFCPCGYLDLCCDRSASDRTPWKTGAQMANKGTLSPWKNCRQSFSILIDLSFFGYRRLPRNIPVMLGEESITRS
jgi:hypothetical protein